ncbi:EF-hand domain-containing protein [Psychroserpens sp. Hel_I_66]|uniref:EF-hand domain-containing protein n=1 Tax=Psychroserpens sp. Hel_I_66 TaxID=1250004 RepID=UPI0006462A9A|nr:EF-hand domain-containing protein [Psychroserpens sp. Hel_I_66]
MATKEIILNKIQILITNHFKTPEAAFAFFDENSDGKLSKSEIKELLKQAEISGFIRGMVAGKLIEGYDKDGDELIDWTEFKLAINEISDTNNK